MTFDEFRATRVRVDDVDEYLYVAGIDVVFYEPWVCGFIWLGYFPARYDGNGKFIVPYENERFSLREAERAMFYEILELQESSLATYADDMIKLRAYLAKEEACGR